MPGSDGPVLKESRTEYFLYVPYALRYRARRIEGRRWDARRKCWALPKNRRVLQDLRLEFGEQLVAQIEKEPGGRLRRWYPGRRRLYLAIVLTAALCIAALVFWIERSAG